MFINNNVIIMNNYYKINSYKYIFINIPVNLKDIKLEILHGISSQFLVANISAINVDKFNITPFYQ